MKVEVTVDGDQLVMTSNNQRLRGRGRPPHTSTSAASEITDGAAAGGRFVMRGTDAEITLIWLGVPVVF